MPDALIWGASGGIGRALVAQLKDAGWRVFAAARTLDRIPQNADFAYRFNAHDPDSIKDAALAIAHDTDGIDLLAYTAGGVVSGPMAEFAPDSWSAVMDANLNGAYLAVRSALNLLNEGAAVMAIGAYVDKIMLPKFGPYTVAKAGLEPMLTILQKEHRKLKFSLVRPPAVDTPFWDNVPFKLPDGALSPDAVATAMIERYNAGEKGLLDL